MKTCVWIQQRIHARETVHTLHRVALFKKITGSQMQRCLDRQRVSPRLLAYKPGCGSAICIARGVEELLDLNS